jgi:hypothetical protein
MTVSHIGLGALVLASALYATAGQADTGKAGSPESQRSETHAAHQRAQMNKSSSRSGHMKERTASGEVKSIDTKALTLASGEQLRLGPKTEFMNGSKKVSRQEVKEGERVRASYQPRGKLAYADRIEIVSNASMHRSSGPAGAKKGSPAGHQK